MMLEEEFGINTDDLELEKEVEKYMKNNEQTCKKTITEEIAKMINGLVNMIIEKAKSVAGKKLEELKNRVALYQVSNTKINPKIINKIAHQLRPGV